MKLIKSLFTAFAVIILFSNADCNKKIRVAHDLDGPSTTMTIPARAAGEFDITQSFNFDLDSVMQQFNLTTANLLNVEPTSAKVTIIDHDSVPVTFDVLDYFVAELSSSTIPTKRIAYKDPVPHTGLTELTPDIDNTTEALEFLKAKDITYHFRAKLNTPLTHPVDVKFEVKWHVVGEL